MLTLQALIQKRRDERGWSYADLAVRSDHKLTRGRWQQLGTNVRLKAFPDPDNIPIIASALEVDQTAVVLAVAASLNLDVRWHGPDLAQMMPAGTDQLSVAVRDAILGVIRATVAEALKQRSDEQVPQPRSASSVLEWGKTDQTGGQDAPPTDRSGRVGGVTSE